MINNTIRSLGIHLGHFVLKHWFPYGIILKREQKNFRKLQRLRLKCSIFTNTRRVLGLRAVSALIFA